MTGWYFDTTEQALWFAKDNHWQRHGAIPLRSRTKTFHRQGETSTPTNPLQKVTVQLHDTKTILTGSGTIKNRARKLEGFEALLQHHFGREWLWELTVIGNLHKLIEDIQRGQGYAVSDGSFQLGKGAAAWIIEGSNGNNQLIGTALSPSDKDCRP